MKRTLSLSSLLIVLGSLLVLSSCNRNDQKTTLQLHGLGDNLSGLTAYLYDEADPKTPIDSIVIQDTVASLSLDNLQKGYLYLLSCEGTQLNAQFVYEETSLDYNLSDGLVSGSPANDACNAFEQDIMVIMQADSIDQAAGQEIVRKYIAEQKDNPLVLRAMQYAMYLFDDLTEFQKPLEEMGENVKRLPSYTTLKELIQGMINTKAGKTFVDFAGITTEGEQVKLSDYVGQGQYALVDFWASWCGPCRREIPTLIQMHKKYKDKGLLVLGIGVWEESHDTHLQAVKELQIPYPQIYDEQNSHATSLYGIMGIPQIMLIGPDGVIMQRDLRGDQIDQILSEIYK